MVEFGYQLLGLLHESFVDPFTLLQAVDLTRYQVLEATMPSSAVKDLFHLLFKFTIYNLGA